MAASMRVSSNCFVFNLNCILKFRNYKFRLGSVLNSNSNRNLSTKELFPYQYCRETVRKYDYENYLCSLLLSDSAVRSAAIVIRAFNAEISQIRDMVSTVSIGEMRFKFWKNALENTFKGNPPEHPVAWEPCLANVHCDHVASHIGKSQGICNLLRAIPYNASKGRLFLPLDLMIRIKLSQERIFRGNEKKNLQDAVYELSSVAHQHLNLGRKLSIDVPKEAKSIFLPAVATAVYLNKLQKTDFDVFHPANQKRNNLLPLSLLFHKLRKKY
ncbi:NADH dehydrogenase (ubiquinone) complex I, assembly factor 6-like [Uloborus diversus]|uniref:NADH dehydrogenase (ubiquinone) complex I, assembly factor 6-like n=1 Tax=Uloborus diversus TaxID=327109 RepID=UPI00240A4A60|nr:NADH dehydrogenase (ubiquinone) complex I, assembly factor 6-like [Uloborus diversus]